MSLKKNRKGKKTIKMGKLPVQIRVPAYLKAQNLLLEKYQLNARLVVSNRKRPGIINRMALWVLKHTGSFLDMEFSHRDK